MKLFRLFIVTLVCVLITPISTAFSLTSEYTSDYDEYGNDVDEDGNYLKGNCVKFIRKLVPSFPSPATSIDEKKSHINSDVAKAGSVAIMTSSYSYKDENDQTVYTGHVGYVESVSGSDITIIDANFGSPDIRRRTGTEDELRIIGYYDPNNTSVTFYENTDTGGWAYPVSVPNGTCVYSGDLVPFSNDQLSCVEISSDGVTVILYEHDKRNGTTCTLTGKGVYNLTDYGFNDTCSSYEIDGKSY